MINPFDEIATRLDRIEHLLLEKKQPPMPIAPPAPSEKLLTIQEAADFLNMKKGSIYQLVHKNSIPFYKRGKHLTFTEKSLRHWVEQTRHQTNEEISRDALKSLSESE